MAQVVGSGEVAPVAVLLAPVDEPAVGPAGPGAGLVHAVAFAQAAAIVGHGAEMLGQRAQFGSLERAARVTGNFAATSASAVLRYWDRRMRRTWRTRSRAKRRFGRSCAS